MRLYTRYKPLRPRKRPGADFYWVLAGLGLAILGWIWWDHATSARPKNEPKPAASSGPRPSPTNRPSPRTHLPARPVALSTVPVPSVVGATNPPPVPPALGAHHGEEILEAQLSLARQGISPGSLDGVLGPQTRAALMVFQHRERLPVTGALDALTKLRLTSTAPLYTNYVITANDLARLRTVNPTWLGKSQQDRLDYETILELVAERSHSHPHLIRRLNPGVNWSTVAAGTTVVTPNAEYPPARGKAAFVRIQLAAKTLEAFDERTNLLAHFPCSIARLVEKRPVGELHVVKIAPNPTYRFDPEIFPESAEARELNRVLMIPAGPNNPVGTAWIGLDRPGYGVHGAPRPEEVGRTESHGCFRLANWNAEYLMQLVSVGTPVYVEP